MRRFDLHQEIIVIRFTNYKVVAKRQFWPDRVIRGAKNFVCQAPKG
jgi:hypothetical protein